jgi:hypothetical protein
MPSKNVSAAAERLFREICDCAAEGYRASIKTDSIPIKCDLNKAGNLDPANFRRTEITGREQVAVIASCICNRVGISPGVTIPRAFHINRELNFIEKGASQDIIASGGAGWIPGHAPQDDRFVLSHTMCERIAENFNAGALSELQHRLGRDSA